jgi:hypothetical protein
MVKALACTSTNRNCADRQTSSWDGQGTFFQMYSCPPRRYSRCAFNACVTTSKLGQKVTLQARIPDAGGFAKGHAVRGMIGSKCGFTHVAGLVERHSTPHDVPNAPQVLCRQTHTRNRIWVFPVKCHQSAAQGGTTLNISAHGAQVAPRCPYMRTHTLRGHLHFP